MVDCQREEEFHGFGDAAKRILWYLDQNLDQIRNLSAEEKCVGTQRNSRRGDLTPVLFCGPDPDQVRKTPGTPPELGYQRQRPWYRNLELHADIALEPADLMPALLELLRRYEFDTDRIRIRRIPCNAL